MATLSTPTSPASLVERFASSWHLFKVSFGVVRAEPALLGLTVFSIVAKAGIFFGLFLGAAALVIPAAVHDLFAGTIGAQSSLPLGVGFIAFSVVYGILVAAPIGAFFGGAISHVAMERIEGRDPSLGDGLGAARARLGALFTFGVINGVANAVTSSSSRNGDGVRTVGDDAADVAKAAARALYALLTSLAIPAIMRERIGGSAAIGRSTAIVRAAWPQATAAGVGITTVTGLLSFAAIAPLIIAFFATLAGLPTTGVDANGVTQVDMGAFLEKLPGFLPLAAVCVPLAFVITTFGGLLQAVFNGALYLYATTGKAGDFAPQDIAGAAVTADGRVRPGAASAK